MSATPAVFKHFVLFVSLVCSSIFMTALRVVMVGLELVLLLVLLLPICGDLLRCRFLVSFCVQKKQHIGREAVNLKAENV